MIILRKSKDRGHTSLDWLESNHSFSFGDYDDPNHRGFGPLRVINEDIIGPGRGFGLHPHRDMEILTYVLEGVLEHKDSLGTGSLIKPGEMQRMTAGTGVFHSEFNSLKDIPLHLLQIWVIPSVKRLSPSYEQKNFQDQFVPGQLTLLASPEGSEGSLKIHQDVFLYVLPLDPLQSFTHELGEGRMMWIQVARGKVTLNGHILHQGDGAAIRAEPALEITGKEKSEILFFDLPKEY